MRQAPAPADVGVRCRHWSRRKVSRRRELCAACDRAYWAKVAPAKVARRLRKRRAAALAVHRARVRDLRRRLYDRRTWRRRDRALRRKYGMTFAQYLTMFEDQGGRCAIDRRELAAPYLDHDHKNKRVRGILCYRCNKALALLRDDPAAASRVADYLGSAADGRTLRPRREFTDAELRRWERRGR